MGLANRVFITVTGALTGIQRGDMLRQMQISCHCFDLLDGVCPSSLNHFKKLLCVIVMVVHAKASYFDLCTADAHI